MDPEQASRDPSEAAAAAPHDALETDDLARYEARVLRSFVRDGRLTAIPAQDRKRPVILRWILASAFPDHGPWAERDVNMRLALICRDVAALRRYLVDAGLMARASGIYRRAVPA